MLNSIRQTSQAPLQSPLHHYNDLPHYNILTSKVDSKLAVPLDSSYMQKTYNTNPSIRVQQSGPHAFTEDSGPGQPAWHHFANTQQRLLPQALENQHWASTAQRHKRNSSGSTIASTGPSSPFTPVSTSYPHIVDPETRRFSSPADSHDPYPKPEAHASNSNLADFFVSPEFRDYEALQQQYAGSQASLRFSLRGNMSQQAAEMGVGSTLQKTASGDFPDEFKSPMDGRNGNVAPKLDRTMSDIYQDELYNPNVAMAAPLSQPVQRDQISTENLLSPRRDVFSERLQAANNGHMSARSGSPADSLSRERSPFRPTSEYANDEISTGHSATPGPHLGTAAKLRERQKAEADARAFVRHQPSPLQNTRTISPKEAFLDIRDQDEESMSPLFNSSTSSRHPVPENDRFDTGVHIPHSPGDLQSSENLDSSVPINKVPVNNLKENPRRQRFLQQASQQYPFISQPRRQNSGTQSTDSVPEFPAQLTSMESTRSDTRSSESQSESTEACRPSSTTADSGTYSCTYHGCAMRFETPAKLQRHKRDSHRQATPPASANNDSVTSRNSQAGPHKCERINPSTGKPCNSIFSRPYDLTRHEDTIHNARKQKVKCQFCTEEKTFSRNDALTRHMRVVHPEVDFPGKTKRKG